jgi:hypothetical protein
MASSESGFDQGGKGKSGRRVSAGGVTVDKIALVISIVIFFLSVCVQLIIFTNGFCTFFITHQILQYTFFMTMFVCLSFFWER